MIYFSYNDYIDCTENVEIDKIKKVEEKIAKYEVRNGKRREQINKNRIIDILRKKVQLKIFLREFLNFNEITDTRTINYCDNIKVITDKEINNNLVLKIKDKEIFIFIKVIENIDTNIAYKVFEHSLNIIKKSQEDKKENKRYPIVIPIVIYTGRKTWKTKNSKLYGKVNYITYDNNKINFSYNMINIRDLKTEDLKEMESMVAKEILNKRITKNKYLQIN